MADVIHVEKGYSPWQPASDARLVKEYGYHDFPFAGVIEQHGVRYYFACVDGMNETVNAWVYAQLTADEEAQLDAASPEQFFDSFEIGGPAVLALAVEGPGVIATHLMESVTKEELLYGKRQLVQQVERLLETARELTPA